MYFTLLLSLQQTHSYTHDINKNPMVLDPEAEEVKVRSLLGDLLGKLDSLHQKAVTYKSYQKNFKVEVTKFEELEDTHAEVKLKQLLWDSQKEWDVAYDGWMKVSNSKLISVKLIFKP